MYIDKVIKGRKAFDEYMAKFRPGQSVSFCENIGHCADVLIEHISEIDPTTGYPQAYFWLIIESKNPDKGFSWIGDRRQEIYEGIRTGRITGAV